MVYVPEPDYFNVDGDDNQRQDPSAIEPYTDAGPLVRVRVTVRVNG